MARLMREKDWSATALGPVERWPASLRSTVRILLTSRYSMWMGWGSDLTFLYNDRYAAETLDSKHPWALGQSAEAVWHEIWPTIGPRIQHVLATGEATWDSDLLLFLERSGYLEETYHSFSYSPLYEDDGEIRGMLCVVTEETTRVIEERRSTLLRTLGTSLTFVLDDAGVYAALRETLEPDARAIPFSVVYELDHEHGVAHAVARTGITADHPGVPATIPIDGGPFDLRTVVSDPTHVHVATLDGAIVWPTGAWKRPADHALLAAIVLPGSTLPHAVFVAAANPHRPRDDAHMGFVRLFVGQLAAALASARVFEGERKRAAALAEIDRAKTTFFSNVSHELRTPLTLLLAPLEEAASNVTLPAGERDALRVAHRNALRLLKLVNALLEFSRIEAGRVRASYEAVDLAAITREHASAFETAMAQGGLRYRVHTEDLGEPAWVDREMWETIVLNLLSNAFKFTHDGEVELSLMRGPRGVRLTVRDTGVGIPAEDLPRLFERFHRVEGSRGRSFEGTGIGLSLVLELVRLHGGTIEAASEVGRGTTFVVDLPLGGAHVQPAEPRRSHTPRRTSDAYVAEAARWLAAPGESLPPPEASRRSSTTSVLVVDDNADMREYLRRIFDRWHTRSVTNGAEALEAIAQARPDLVIADVMMPVMDGMAMLAQVRQSEATRDLPVLLLSARAGEEARTEGLEAGADDYLVKPFSARELVARAETLVLAAQKRRREHAQREFLESLVSRAPVAIAVWTGPEHVFEIANEAFLSLTGRVDVIGKRIRDVFPEQEASLAAVWVVLDEVYRTGVTFSTSEQEVRFDRKNDGGRETGWFAFHIAALHDENGEVSGLVQVVIDVTEQVLARRRIELLRKAAEDASRAKDDFLGVLSHELRTPLNAIVGWSSLLGQGRVASDQVPRAMEAIERNARAQARLIEDLLDLSRIEQGKLVLSVGPIEMVKVVEAAIDVVRPAAEAKRVRIQAILDSHATIVGDADRLQQVVWNLLSNAIKFTPPEGRVQITLHRASSYVSLTVADTGEGIEPSFLPMVFERFRQADPSSRRRAGGLGLGLAIVRSLVEMHGGTVTAASDGLGTGATFEVRLPTAPLRADRAPTPAPEVGGFRPVTFDAPPELVGRKLLVVDDEPDTRDLICYLLGQCGIDAVPADGGASALRLLTENRFDAMISDVGMPQMDGFALIERVRALPDERARIPAIALTAYARAEDRTRLMRAGFDMHVSKPVEPSELVTVLATVLRSRARDV